MFNEEMTSKMQHAAERPGDEVELFWLLKKNGGLSLVSRVRTTAGTRRNNS